MPKYDVEVEVTLYRTVRVEVSESVRGITERAQKAEALAERETAMLWPFAERVRAVAHQVVGKEDADGE